MFRNLTNSLIAATLVLSSFTATPAHADEKDVAKALAAIIGIAVVGKIIKDAKDDKKKVTRRRPLPPLEPRPMPDLVDDKLLPPHCLRTFDTYDGAKHMFGRRCLEKHYFFAQYLPDRCLRYLDTFNGFREAYAPRCLRRKGYSLARN